MSVFNPNVRNHDPKAILFILDTRINSKIRVEGEHHIYTGTRNAGSGAPIATVPYSNPVKQVSVRRYIYDRDVRPLETKERVFVTCRYIDCVNPAHLVAVLGSREFSTKAVEGA